MFKWLVYLVGAFVSTWIISTFIFASNEKVIPFDMDIINGISLVAPVNSINEPVFNKIKNINATWVSLMPYAYFSTDNPVIHYDSPRQWWGEKTDGIIKCIRQAKSQQLKVLLKPHLWLQHGGYTGDFSCRDEERWDAWEQSYRDYILHYAKIADTMHVEMFCLGTELGKAISERTPFWNDLIDTLRIVYFGKLVYAANWDDYQRIPFWEKLDAIGIDAYFPLCKSQTPKLAEMLSSWKAHRRSMEKYSKKQNKPVVFTEFGYRDADFAANEPWTESSEVVNTTAQCNAYEALFQSLQGQNWFKGGFVWKWYADDYYTQYHGPDFTPQGKPAEKIIEQWYSNAWQHR